MSSTRLRALGSKKAEPKKPEKAEQEPRPAEQEQQKKDAQKQDAPAPPVTVQPSPNPIASEGAAEKKEDKKWDVNNPPGPQYDVPIDVTEGTWLSLDVSPDGNEIAFDLSLAREATARGQALDPVITLFHLCETVHMGGR